jgi:hypothetical protein
VASGESNAKRHERSAAELRAALERLLAGAPTHPDLKESCRISIVCVAKEAGLTPQAVHRRHKGIVAEIANAKAGHKPAKLSKTAELLHISRREQAELRDKLANVISQNATMLVRATEAENALKAAREEIARSNRVGTLGSQSRLR